MADVSTEVAIATQTLSSAASSITFNSIPSTYTDLRVVFTGSTVTTGYDYLLMQFNGDTATNYSYTSVYGDGTSAVSNRSTNRTGIIPNIGTSTTIGFITYDVFSYKGSTYKTVLCSSSEEFNSPHWVNRAVGLWRSTAAITSVTLVSSGPNLAIGSTATLYGIL